MRATDFLTFEEIPLGSWWRIAQGGNYGYCVIDKNALTQDIHVISTIGERRNINYFKLQYRYIRVTPNKYE